MKTGFLYALAAFGTWGLFPLYLQFVRHVPAVEVMLHRSLWALCFVVLLLTVQRHWAWLKPALRQPRLVGTFVVTATLLTGNWLTYVYAVQSGQVLETSLGYFINPLVSVLLGVLVLKERLRAPQWLAVGLAAAGVLWLTLMVGRLPWIALLLAFSFGIYGLLRKTAALGAMEGLALENLLLAPVVLPLLTWWTLKHGGVLAFARPGDGGQLLWLMLGGPLSAFPLMCFAAAARRLPLAMVGMVQYISPSMQFLLAVLYFHEPFDARRLVGFAFIWAGLLLLSADALGLRARRPTMAA
jgi:chloramphenicol-sensitive protein RarD